MEGTVRKPNFVKSTKFYLAILLVAALTLSSWYGASYYLEKTSPKSEASNTSGANFLPVYVLFNYGNGTRAWSNSTRFPSGSSFYNVTVFLTNGRLDAPTSSYGHFVKAINGVKANDQSFWAFWIHCTKDNAWALSPAGADAVAVGANGVFVTNSGSRSFLLSNALAWSLQGFSDTNSPVPGAATVERCST